MPAIAEPPVQVEAPNIPQDGGFSERLGQAIQADPNSAKTPGFGAPKPDSATLTPPKPSDASTGLETGKEGTPDAKSEDQKPEKKAGASDLLKKLAAGEPKEEAKPLPTPEQKKEYTMKELRLRAEKAETLEKELADARKEIETAKAQGATPDQIKVLTTERDAIKAERDDFKKKLAAQDVMQSEPYIENVTKPMEAIWKDLHKASEDFKFSWPEFANALTVQDHRQRLSAISKVLDGAEGEMDALNKNDLVGAVIEFVQRESYGRQLLDNAGKAQEALKADQARKSAEEKERAGKTFNEQAESIFKQMFSEDTLEDMPFLAPKDDDGKPVPDKALMEQIRKSAKAEKEPWRNALDSYSTEVLPLVLEHSKKQEAEIAELKERIGKLSGAGPKGGGEIKREDGQDADAGLTLQERVEKQMKAQGRM